MSGYKALAVNTCSSISRATVVDSSLCEILRVISQIITKSSKADSNDGDKAHCSHLKK